MIFTAQEQKKASSSVLIPTVVIIVVIGTIVLELYAQGLLVSAITTFIYIVVVFPSLTKRHFGDIHFLHFGIVTYSI